MIDQADQKLRAAQISGGDQTQRAAVDPALTALADAREVLALRAASSDATHASGSDIESRLLRSIAGLDAALGAIRTALGVDAAPTKGGTPPRAPASRCIETGRPIRFRPWVRPHTARSTSCRRRSATQSYLADRGLATAIYLSLSLGKPLLLEGEAGVGQDRGREGPVDAAGPQADPAPVLRGHRRLAGALRVELLPAADRGPRDGRGRCRTHVEDLFGPEFLVERPLLAAIRAGTGAVLLVDELDRADDEFEAFLLEILSEFAVTIPEMGRVAAATPPAVIVTSNRTRELHDALKRRCLYHWIDHPALEREIEIVARARAARGRGPRARRRRGGRAAARDGPGEAPRRGRDDRLGERAGVPGRRAARRGRWPPTRSARS